MPVRIWDVVADFTLLEQVRGIKKVGTVIAMGITWS